MNGLGIGLVVAAGIAIGFTAGAPGEFSRHEMALTIMFWSFMAGTIFEMYRLAFKGRSQRRR
jgi:hypothetical protein